MTEHNHAKTQIPRDSDFGRNLARRIRDLNVEINSLEGSRDRVAGLLEEFDDRLEEQRRHRKALVTEEDELLP